MAEIQSTSAPKDRDTPEFEEKVDIAELVLSSKAIEPFEIKRESREKNQSNSSVKNLKMEAYILKLFQKLIKGNGENQTRSFESPKTLLRIKKLVEKFTIMDNERLLEVQNENELLKSKIAFMIYELTNIKQELQNANTTIQGLVHLNERVQERQSDEGNLFLSPMKNMNLYDLNKSQEVCKFVCQKCMKCLKTLNSLKKHFVRNHPEDRGEIVAVIYGRIISKNEDNTSSKVQESQKEIAPTQGEVKNEENLVTQTTELRKDEKHHECTKSENQQRPCEKIKSRWIKRFRKETLEEVEKITFLCQECQLCWKSKKDLEAHLGKIHPGVEGELKVTSCQNGREIKIKFIKKRLHGEKAMHGAKRSADDTQYLASKFLKLN